MTTELSGHEFNSHSEPILYSYSNFIFCSVSDFTSAIAFVSYHVYFNWNVREVITWVLGNELIHLVFITERSFEVAIESWPEWNLNLRPLTSVQMLYKAMSYSQLCTATPISSFGQCQISFRLLPSTFFLSIKEMDPVFYHYNTNVLGKTLSYNGLRQKIGSISLGWGTNSGACLRFQSCDFNEGFLCSCMLRCFKPGMLRGLSIQPTW